MSTLKLGHKLKDIRIKTGLSQKAFAERIGTTQQNISNYENGLTEPSLDCLKRIASEFSVSLDGLLLGKSACIEQEILDIVASMPEDRKQLSKKILQTMLDDESQTTKGAKMYTCLTSVLGLLDIAVAKIPLL